MICKDGACQQSCDDQQTQEPDPYAGFSTERPHGNAHLSLPDLCALFCAFLIAFLAVLGDHIAGPAAAVFQGDIARRGGGERAQAIDDDILHGIGQGGAAYQHLAVAGHEFLHVQAQQAVKGKFIDFPYFI